MRSDGRRARPPGGSAVSVADWNGDGRLDLVAGTVQGEVWVMAGAGARDGRPCFDVARKLELDENEPTPHRDAGPLVVD